MYYYLACITVEAYGMSSRQLNLGPARAKLRDIRSETWGSRVMKAGC